MSYLHTNLLIAIDVEKYILNLLGSNIFSFSFNHDIVQMGKGRSAVGILIHVLAVVCKKNGEKIP